MSEELALLLKWERWFKRLLLVFGLGVIIYVSYKYGREAGINFVCDYMERMQSDQSHKEL